ncbi:MAG TPA: hypothetical protein VHD83_24215 [Puia sp.]|nr:hypothetical protein [Puia sp.]
MIRHTETSRDQLHKYDHLIPPMKKVLKFTAGATWFMMKTLIKAAWRLPGLIHRMAEHHQPVTTSKPREMPSPATAFPAP